MTKDQENIIELIDENDERLLFEHIMTLDYGNREYIVLKPMDQTDEASEDEVVILRVEQDDNGDDVYVSIDNDDEIEEVFDAFNQVLEQEDVE